PRARSTARVPGRSSVALLVADLERDARAAGVELRLGTPATAAVLRALGADAVVLATGAAPPARTALAVEEAFEGERPATIDAWRAMDDPAALGERVLVVDDDGTARASGVLLALAASGAAIEVVTPFEQLLPHVGTGYERQLVLRSLAAGGVVRRTAARVRLDGGRAWAVDVLTGEATRLADPTAIVALTPPEALGLDGHDAEELEAALGVPVLAIGDARSPRGIDAAIAEAWQLARDAAA
ncbi:hypothetical protein JQT67_09995, partial [Agrococcus sp. TF02-5]|nr:hypothetical protein [Agrococcus sp. TF02-05]